MSGVTLAFHLFALPAHVLAGRVALRAGGWPGLVRGASLLAAALAALGALLGEDAFGVFRLWGVSVFAHLPAALVAWSLLSRRGNPRPRVPPVVAFGTATLVVAVGVDAYWIEPTWLEVTRPEISSPKLDRPLTVAVLADIQTDAIGEYERATVERAVAERPDLVLLTGDYLQAPRPVRRREAPRFRELMRLLRPPLGAYAVGGNMDSRGWPRLFDDTPVTVWTETRTLDLGPLTITGLSLTDSVDGVRMGPPPGFHLVFGHHPDFALSDVPADLLVAGHTHGGQVRLPVIGPLLTFSRVPRGWAAGVTPLDDVRTLVVSRGIGMERGHAPRLRFLCRPELTILRLVPQK